MSSAALSLPALPEFDEREPTDAERLDLMTHHVHDVISENAALRRQIDDLARDNASLVSRTRQMERALLALAPERLATGETPYVVGRYNIHAPLSRVLLDAQSSAMRNEEPVLAFVRDQEGWILGVELRAIPGAADEYVTAGPIERRAAQIGMAVVA